MPVFLRFPAEQDPLSVFFAGELDLDFAIECPLALGPWGGWDMPVSVVALEQRGTEVAATVVAPSFVGDWPRPSGG
ncbi:MAG: hypothetical protein VX808_07710 [Actinomycetota bacterium]|nr:hypothetical protein [Actinomycetota bacterium]